MIRFIFNHVVLISVSWIVMVFILCATPGRYIPSATWLDLLSFDKLVHAGIFAVMLLLLYVVKLKKTQRLFTLGSYVIFCVIYGVSLEIMQAKVFTGRSADWKDIIANCAGCVIAMTLFKKTRKTLSEKRLI